MKLERYWLFFTSVLARAKVSVFSHCFFLRIVLVSLLKHAL
jgi:hypothetical protein